MPSALAMGATFAPHISRLSNFRNLAAHFFGLSFGLRNSLDRTANQIKAILTSLYYKLFFKQFNKEIKNKSGTKKKKGNSV